MAKFPKVDRRKFLETSLVGVGATVGASMLGIPGHAMRIARAVARRRRHLIYCAGFGGWDSYLAHQSLLSADAKGLAMDSADSLQAGSRLTLRFSDADLTRMNDPKGGPRYMGPVWQDSGMNLVQDDVLVWRGMAKEGEHGDGNAILHMGALTNYAASSAALIAQDLALDYMRPLHYVQVSNSPTDLAMISGLLSSAASTPINIPDLASWVSITSDGTSGAENFRRSFIGDSIGRLSRNLSSALTAPGAAAYSSFAQAAVDTRAIRGTNYGTSKSFADILTDLRAVRDDVINKAIAAKRFMAFGQPNGRANVLGGQNYESTLFGYALAYFLIANDLSAVVALPTPTGDNHDFDDNHYLNLTVTFAFYRHLIEKLKGVENPDIPGTSVFDCTTLALDTEFDRQYVCSYLNALGSGRPGTGHGNSTSVILAGKGIAMGRVIGDIQTGPAGPYSSFTSNPFTLPLPIDFATGIPDADGMMTSQRSMLPTILAAFGVGLPIEQNSGFTAVPAVIKC